MNDIETPATAGDPALDLVIVTGLSGAGRSTVARALEDSGYYVVDNLPSSLVEPMVSMARESQGIAHRMALVLDIRSRAFSTDLVGTIRALRDAGERPRVVFLDASDEMLIRRYESARRRHPLQGDGRIVEGIAAERELLHGVRAEADLMIVSTDLNVNQLRARVESTFGSVEDGLVITMLSFGFKYGIPGDADLLVDVRFLPNPHWVPQLRPRNGLDTDVSDYVLASDDAQNFLDRFTDLLAVTTPGYLREGKRYLTVGVGCTGGKHRSVAMASELAARLQLPGCTVRTAHRDMGRE